MTENTHKYYMTRALHLAQLGLYTTDPNPRVGCVIVNNGRIVGEGFHERAGEAHAEIHALRQAAQRARGAQVYVTLEPCSHEGLTPPCVSALIQAGIQAVWIAMRDPNPQVNGSGVAQLRKAGIPVEVGLLETQAAQLNPGYTKRMTKGLPLTRVKMAMSTDGRTAMKSGESQWITGAAARQDVQRLRARSSAIITGVGTVLQDDPSLTIRAQDWQPPYPFLHEMPDQEQVASNLQPSPAGQRVRQPLRVLLDTHFRANFECKIFQPPGQVLWVGTRNVKNVTHKHILESAMDEKPIECLLLDDMDEEHHVDLTTLLRHLASLGCNEVLIEAGATVAGAFIAQQCVDELWLYMAPKLLGSSAQPLVQCALEHLSDALPLHLTNVQVMNKDVRLIYQVLPLLTL